MLKKIINNIKIIVRNIIKIFSLLLVILSFIGGWLMQGQCLCFSEDWQGFLINVGFLVIMGIFIYSLLSNKNSYILLMLSIILFIYSMIMPSFSFCMKSFSCVSNGGCWDYNRNKCEMKEQGYCVRNQEDCTIKWKGVWDDGEQFCIIQNKK
jgi:membrane-bound ClpP family serine protease